MWSDVPTDNKWVGPENGIIRAKAELNALHCDLAEHGFNQVSQSVSQSVSRQLVHPLNATPQEKSDHRHVYMYM